MMKLPILLLLLPSVVNAAVYRAWIHPFGDESQVYGTVTVFANLHPGGVVAYYGSVDGVPPNLAVPDCTATNACGAHIHEGMSCESTDAQGGHLYDQSVVPEDPWLVERYTSNYYGSGYFSGTAAMGTEDVDGKAFVVHDETGARIGCGLLQRVSNCGTHRHFMCPPFSTVQWNTQCLYSPYSCVCDAGFWWNGRTCYSVNCGDYQCPLNSVVNEGVTCLQSFRQCTCIDGYHKRGGYCVQFDHTH